MALTKEEKEAADKKAADEKAPEKVATDKKAADKKAAAEKKKNPPTREELEEQLATAEKSLKNKTEEATRVHKKLEVHEAADKKRKEENMTESEKLKVRADELEAENETLKLESRRLEVATATGLPLVFADRLNGETTEEMTEDAEKILAVIPEAKKIIPKIDPTNPKGAKQANETDAQRRRRLGLHVIFQRLIVSGLV